MDIHAFHQAGNALGVAAAAAHEADAGYFGVLYLNFNGSGPAAVCLRNLSEPSPFLFCAGTIIADIPVFARLVFSPEL